MQAVDEGWKPLDPMQEEIARVIEGGRSASHGGTDGVVGDLPSFMSRSSLGIDRGERAHGLPEALAAPSLANYPHRARPMRRSFVLPWRVPPRRSFGVTYLMGISRRSSLLNEGAKAMRSPVTFPAGPRLTRVTITGWPRERGCAPLRRQQHAS